MARIILVSNAPEIDLDIVQGLITGPDCAIVQFNTCAHFDRVKHLDAEKIYFFNVPDYGVPFGFDADGQPLFDYGSGKMLFSAKWPGDNKKLTEIAQRTGGTIIDRNASGLGFYETAQYGFVPSIGYQAAMHFSLQDHEVCLVGFDGDYPSGGHFGHNFFVEQMFMKSRPNISFFPDRSRLQTSDGFASVFGDDYDFSAKPPILLLNVAKALFREGRAAHAQRFIDALSIKFPNTHRAAFDLSVVDSSGIAGKSRFFNKRLLRQFRQDRQGLDRIEMPFDVQKEGFGYSKREGGKRVLLLNETSRLSEVSWHIGCHVVVGEIYKKLAEKGIDCVGWINDSSGLSEILKLDPDLSFDAVLVNAEGTFHDTAPRAVNLLFMLDHLKRRFGKKVFFINGVWQNNAPFMEDIVDTFDLIALRETASAAHMLRKQDVLVVPDMTWNVQARVATKDPGSFAVTDSVNKEDLGRLFDECVAKDGTFFVMGNYNRHVLTSLRRNGTLPQVAKTAHDFGPFERVLTGRFHGACLALQSGAVVHYLPSNTHKTEALFADIGLDPEKFRWRSGQAQTSAYDDAETALIARYKQNALKKIDALFDQISNLL